MDNTPKHYLKLTAETQRSLSDVLELVAIAKSPLTPDALKVEYLAGAIDIVDGILALKEHKYLA